MAKLDTKKKVLAYNKRLSEKHAVVDKDWKKITKKLDEFFKKHGNCVCGFNIVRHDEKTWSIIPSLLGSELAK